MKKSARKYKIHKCRFCGTTTFLRKDEKKSPNAMCDNCRDQLRGG